MPYLKHKEIGLRRITCSCSGKLSQLLESRAVYAAFDLKACIVLLKTCFPVQLNGLSCNQSFKEEKLNRKAGIKIFYHGILLRKDTEVTAIFGLGRVKRSILPNSYERFVIFPLTYI